ncbi:MAG: GAF domain-containing protein [Bacteroidetes bacterium]|nr:GAF domain-containing protein [Bacteroidota bacterium]
MSHLPLTNTLTHEIDELNRQAWSLNRKNALNSIELATKALSKSQKINYIKGCALAKKTLGACHVWVSKNDEAANYCFEAIALFQSINDKINEAETNYYLGANFFYLSDYDSSIKYYKNSYDISQAIDFEPGMADGLNGMGTVYYTIEQNEKALQMLDESEKLCIKHNVKEILVKVKDGLGETYHNLKQYDNALKYYYECIELTNELNGLQQVRAFALDGLGRTYAGLKRFDKALECYTQSLELRKELGFKFGVAQTLTNIGKLYIIQLDNANAIKHLKEAYDLSLEIGSKEGVFQSSEKLAELYEQEKNTQKALEYYKIFHSAKEEVRNYKSAQLSKSLELQNKVLQSQAEKAILEERAKELENFSESLTLMSQIGQQIISSLSVETIVNTVYKSVNGLMDAVGFGIGLFRKEDNAIVFPIYIEGEQTFKDIKYDITDTNRLTVICYNTSHEIIINDFKAEIGNYIKKYNEPKAGGHVESIIYLPLIYKEVLLGVITVQSFNKNAYSNYHVNILKNLATYTAIALENANLYKEQEQKVEDRTLELLKSKEEIELAYKTNKKINDIGREITSNLNLGQIFKKLYHSINEIMSVECFGVRIYKPEINSVEYKFEMERGEVYEKPVIIPLTDDDNYTVWCIKNKKDIFLNDNKKEYSKYVKQIKVVTGDMPNSLMFTPMMIGDKLIGVITVQSFKFNAYQPQHLEVLKTLATYTATALENAYLYEYMEEKVKARTQEVVTQKEQIEKTFANARLVTEIGKEISSTFSIQEIISKVYTSVNQLMDATMFGIGIYDQVTQKINFSGVIENQKRLDDYFYSLDQTERPAVWCFTNQKEYVIHSFSEEFVKNKRITDTSVIQGAATESIIYVPVTQNNKHIGVLTVQSYLPNVYTDYHLQLIKSLAVYTAIAIDNASLYTNLEVRVKERTQEIEKNYNDTRLLGQIAEEISSSLEVRTIISKVYANINNLMKADCFGIGVYNSNSHRLDFPGFVELGQVLADSTIDVKDVNRLATHCFINETEIFTNDYGVEYVKYIKGIQKPIAGQAASSIIYLPIYSKAKCIGVITVQSYDKNTYTAYHLNILKNLAVSIGIALDNASLYQNLEEKVNERTKEVVKQKEQIEKTFENTRLVSEIGQEISSTFSIEDIIRKVYNRINKLMDATMFGIGIFDAESQKINFKGAIEEGSPLDEYDYELTDVGRPAVIAFTNQTDIVIDSFTDEFINKNKVKNRHSLPGRNTESIIYLPLTQNNKKIGVITVQSYQPHAYNDYHLQLLKNLALFTAIALDNASLYTDMEDRVKERTDEITTAYENTRLLSQIAEDISASLSVETISSKLYENVNKLMDATMFGIGLYNPANNCLEFKGFIENNEVMPDFSYQANDPNRLAAYCFVNETEFLIKDYYMEYKEFIKGMAAPVSGKDSSSIVYIPLYSKGKTIGVFTVQTYEKNAYSEYQFNILKNLAVSIGIALDNANLYQNLEQKVMERTTEVHKQKAIIEEKNKDITDSIRYAKKIQQAIAPNIEEFNRNFTDSFILYKPKDIVSGDFYWFDHFENNTTVFAAADCTGHGVPGAFMSLICSDIMYKVINDQKIYEPAKALTSIDERLVQLIKKSSEASANDGMDIALCTYYKAQGKLQYAGAHRPLLLIRNKQIIEYRPNKYSIGGHTTDGKHFDLTEVDVMKGDLIYLLTDGYADQFGGDSGKKFKYKNFKELIVSICNKPMWEQKEILDETFEAWRGSLEQIDDVCVIGVKI